MAVTRQMTDEEKRLFALFKRAVEAEQDAQAMYEEAMTLCTDPTLKQVLETFYQDEVRHEREIMGRYKAFREKFEI